MNLSHPASRAPTRKSGYGLCGNVHLRTLYFWSHRKPKKIVGIEFWTARGLWRMVAV